jgi:ribonucleotide reductase beta subunit family protein with ferritin-like domain
LKAEFKYIDKVFENGDLETITSSQLKNFMVDRANRKLKELGYKPKFMVRSGSIKRNGMVLHHGIRRAANRFLLQQGN